MGTELDASRAYWSVEGGNLALSRWVAGLDGNGDPVYKKVDFVFAISSDESLTLYKKTAAEGYQSVQKFATMADIDFSIP